MWLLAGRRRSERARAEGMEGEDDTDALRAAETGGLPPPRTVMPAAARRVAELEEALDSLATIEAPDLATSLRIARYRAEAAELRLVIAHATKARAPLGTDMRAQIQELEAEHSEARRAAAAASRERSRAAKAARCYAQVHDVASTAEVVSATRAERGECACGGADPRTAEGARLRTGAVVSSRRAAAGAGDDAPALLVGFPRVEDAAGAQRLREIALDHRDAGDLVDATGVG